MATWMKQKKNIGTPFGFLYNCTTLQNWQIIFSIETPANLNLIGKGLVVSHKPWHGCASLLMKILLFC